MKTGFGKYIGVDPQGQLVAVADAIGTRERFEAIFQDVRFTCLKNHMTHFVLGQMRHPVGV